MTNPSYDRLLLVGYPQIPGPAAPAIPLWLAGGQGSPDGFNKQPAGEVAHGTINGLNFNLQTQPSRIDLFVSPVAAPNNPAAPQAFSDVDSALKSAGIFMAQALATAAIGRYALVLEATEIAQNAADSVSRLKAYIPGVSFPSSAVEASYQVTAPRTSSSNPGVPLLALARWNTVKLFYINMIANGLQPQQIESFAISQTGDLSTDPQSHGLVSDSTSLFAEFGAAAKEILEKGAGAL